jgi:glycosyltransferase involved in cell wall biosynthesis
MNVLHLTQADGGGGAARAAFRLHHSLLANGISSKMRVGQKCTDLESVEGPMSRIGRAIALIRPALGSSIAGFQKSGEKGVRTPAIIPSGLVHKINNSSADVLNIHWIGGEYLSVKDIRRITKPLVWTLHDMWPFCGTEHYAPDDVGSRWRNGYTAINRNEGDRGLDVDRWTWERKRKMWSKKIHLIAPSRWLTECVRSSKLMGQWPITTIPYSIDTTLFKPWPKDLSREILNLPKRTPLVLFGSIGGTRDPRKGSGYLMNALDRLVQQMPDVQGVIFGQSKPGNVPTTKVDLHWLGPLHDDVTLALAYSAADVMVVPSLQDNLPQTGTEAQACGCPVVAFDCSGLPDVVANRETGYLAKPYDSEDLAHGIGWVLIDHERLAKLGAAARERAVRLWSPEVVVPQYLDVYIRAIAST